MSEAGLKALKKKFFWFQGIYKQRHGSAGWFNLVDSGKVSSILKIKCLTREITYPPDSNTKHPRIHVHLLCIQTGIFENKAQALSLCTAYQIVR